MILATPVFHGCRDWHSAVHGTWALIAYTRATGDPQFVPLIEEVLSPELLAIEQAKLADEPRFEMPYGRAWFLRLALEHHRTFDSDLLTDFVNSVASSLVSYYSKTNADPHSREYDSASWALINLLDYAKARGDLAGIRFVESIVWERLLPYDAPCPIEREQRDWPDFMAVCTNWAWLVSKVLDSQSFSEWISGFLPEDILLRPVSKPLTAHHCGMNFSRAWGLFALANATDDLRYFIAYTEHFQYTFDCPNWWRGDYRKVGHWVPQFGMLALLPLFDLRIRVRNVICRRHQAAHLGSPNADSLRI